MKMYFNVFAILFQRIPDNVKQIAKVVAVRPPHSLKSALSEPQFVKHQITLHGQFITKMLECTLTRIVEVL